MYDNLLGRTFPLFFLFVLAGAAGCVHPADKKKDKTGNFHPVEIRYARGFRVDTSEKVLRAEVLRPWQGRDIRQFRYIVSPATNTGKKSPPGVLRVAVSPQRIICTSTTHIAFLDQLHELDRIVAVSGRTLTNNSYLLKKLREGTVADIGYDRDMDYEQIISLHPDLVFLYGVGPEVTATLLRLASLNIPAVIVGDYLEPSPLGRAEWIKFIAAFFGKEKKAVAWFDSLAARYNEARYNPAQSPGQRPLVMTGLPWNEVWYVTGNGGLTATLIRDAGGRYVWQDLEGADAVPMDIEQVYRKAGSSDIWINCGTASSLQEIINTDERLGLFAPVKKGQVYNNNARINEKGGNDYWESGVVHPDLILLDLRHIFHPAENDGYRLFYYRHLQ